MLKIEAIKPKDYQTVHDLVVEAFSNSEHGYHDEAKLVEKIREEATYNKELELIATLNNQIVGHGLLSEVLVKDDKKEHIGLVLAPLSVLTNQQRTGVGSQLMIELEKRAASHNYPFISILGDPEYYAKFGYYPAADHGINCPFEVPEANFMIKEMISGNLSTIKGNLIYNKAFN